MKICKIDNCNDIVYAKELCSNHYQKQLRINKKKKLPPKICKYEECNNIIPLDVYPKIFCSDECRKLEFNRKGREKYKEDPIKNNIRTQKYWEENKWKINQWQIEYYYEHKDKLEKARKEYRTKNKEKIKEKNDEYRKNNPEIVRSRIYKRRAIIKNLDPIQKGTLNKLMELQEGLCYNIFCQCDLTKLLKKDITFEHDLPITKGGTNDLNNLTLFCRSCNSTKNNKTISEFYEYIMKIKILF